MQVVEPTAGWTGSGPFEPRPRTSQSRRLRTFGHWPAGKLMLYEAFIPFGFLKRPAHSPSSLMDTASDILVTLALVRGSMALRIEDYAIIGDCKSAALVGSDGSIDWLCWPLFRSGTCFAALLGTPENGRWLIAPALAPLGLTRRYRPGTLVLETEFKTESGRAVIVDFHASGGWGRAGADRRGPIGARGLSYRICRPVRLWIDGPLDQPPL